MNTDNPYFDYMFNECVNTIILNGVDVKVLATIESINIDTQDINKLIEDINTISEYTNTLDITINDKGEYIYIEVNTTVAQEIKPNILKQRDNQFKALVEKENVYLG